MFVARSAGLGPYFYNPATLDPTEGEYITYEMDADYVSRGSDAQAFFLSQAGTYRIDFEATVANLVTQADIDARQATDPLTWTDPTPALYLRQGPTIAGQTEIQSGSAWPFTTAVDEQFQFTQQFTFTYDGGSDNTFSVIFKAQPDSFLWELSKPIRFFNTKMKITKIA